MNGHVPKVDGVPISGLAVTLDQAAADFKRGYERMREKAGLPKPQRRYSLTVFVAVSLRSFACSVNDFNCV